MLFANKLAGIKYRLPEADGGDYTKVQGSATV